MNISPFAPIAAVDKLWAPHQNDLQTVMSSPRRTAVDLMRIFLANRVVITAWGPVGARKTRTIEAMKNEVDPNGVAYQVITVQPSTIDPTVIHGLYYTSQDEDGKTLMLRSIPEIAERIVNYHRDAGGYTILFLDEMTTCSPAQQNAMLGLLTHGQFGDVNILDCTAFVMAANPEGTVSTVNPLSEAVINRGGHIAWYGDPQLFLDDWSSGFGNDAFKPEDSTEWYIRSLIEGSMEKAFRSDEWDVDDLVPYELFQHSERTTTELAKIITYINNEFASYPQWLRHFYIIKSTEALQGPEWAKRMDSVCKTESRVMTHAKLKSIIAEHGIERTTDYDSLVGKLQQSMFQVESTSTKRQEFIAQDVVNELSDKLERAFTDKGDYESYLTLWAFATTAYNPAVAASIHPTLLKAMKHAAGLAKNGEIMREEVVPAFAQQETKDSLKQLQANL